MSEKFWLTYNHVFKTELGVKDKYSPRVILSIWLLFLLRKDAIYIRTKVAIDCTSSYWARYTCYVSLPETSMIGFLNYL